MKKPIKKAQAGTSLGQKITSKRPKLGTKSVGRSYEKNTGEGSKNFGKSDAGKLKPTYGGAKGGRTIKKAQFGRTIQGPLDERLTKILEPQSQADKNRIALGLPNYGGSPSSEPIDSMNPKMKSLRPKMRQLEYEREEQKQPIFRNPRLKSGGKIVKKTATKKGGMAAFEKSSFDKKADAKGLHGKEGSPKDMKADKAAAKKLGFLKNKKK